MSNYDNLLRRKEEEASFDTQNKDMHWQAMAGLLGIATPPAPKTGGAKVISMFKWILIVTGVVGLSYWGYQQLTRKKKQFNGVLKPSNVPSQYFTININEDAVIRTAHASKLTIKKGTFKTDKPVTIEVKEVFTPEEILLSGLTTLSDGKPLKSAGMLYFNATAEGETIEPSIPVEAFVATKEKDPDMQLFKGEMQADSTVDWVKPSVITDTTNPLYDLDKFAAGKALFQAKCASCHQTFSDRTGPALRNLQYRGPWKDPRNLLRWINNPAAFMATDPYTQDLKYKYGSMMTAFPEITQWDVENMVVYWSNTVKEEYKPNTVAADSAIAGFNDCGYDTSYYSVQNSFEEYDTTGFVYFDTIQTDTIGEMIYDYSEYEESYRQGYDFQITNNGWYNIDAFLNTDRNDLEEVSLTAEIVNGEDLSYNVYVFVPTERVLQTYTKKKGNTYSFAYANSTLPLPLRYRAVIFAFGSSGQRIMYGASEFIIQKDQQIRVELKETSKEGLMNVLYTNNINGVSIEAIEKEMSVIPVPCPAVADTAMKRPVAETPATIGSAK